MRIILLIALSFMVAACGEKKEDGITAIPLQQGLYYDGKCKWDVPADAYVNPCYCKADIQAAFTGDKQLDGRLTKELEAALCPGTPSKDDVSGKLISQRSGLFEVTRDDARYLSVVYTLYEVFAGAAHGRSWRKALIYDKKAERWLEQNEIVPPEKRSEVSNAILFQLLEQNRTKYNGGLTLSELSNYNLLTDYGCNRCVIYPAEDGWKVVFEHYAIASYAYGIVEVTLPDKDIGR